MFSDLRKKDGQMMNETLIVQTFKLIIQHGESDNIETVRQWLKKCLQDNFYELKGLMIDPAFMRQSNYPVISGKLIIAHQTVVTRLAMENLLNIDHPTIHVQEVTKMD